MESRDVEEIGRTNEKKAAKKKKSNAVLWVILCITVLILVGIISYGISYLRRLQEEKDREAFLAIATTTLPPTRAPQTPTAIPTAKPTPNPANILTPSPTKKLRPTPTKKPKATSPEATQRPTASPKPTPIPMPKSTPQPTRSPKPTSSPVPAGIYPEGQYKVGVDIPAGEYVLLLSEADKGGMFIVSTDANAENVIYYDYFHGNSIATVKNGEYLKLSSCYAKKFSSVKSLNTSGEGMFKVGTHIPAGEYKLTTTEDDIGGMYTVSGDSRKEEVIAWDYFKGSAYVQVKNGQYLILNGCKIIE